MWTVLFKPQRSLPGRKSIRRSFRIIHSLHLLPDVRLILLEHSRSLTQDVTFLDDYAVARHPGLACGLAIGSWGADQRYQLLCESFSLLRFCANTGPRDAHAHLSL